MTEEKLNSIKKYFEKFDYISFSVLFGSYANSTAHNLSDIDLGIYVNKELTLLEHGLLITELENISKLKVDLLILNNLYKKNPELAYNIVTNCKILTLRSKENLVDYKTETFLYYFDTEYLRKETKAAFLRRLNNGNFGKQNYVE